METRRRRTSLAVRGGMCTVLLLTVACILLVYLYGRPDIDLVSGDAAADAYDHQPVADTAAVDSAEMNMQPTVTPANSRKPDGRRNLPRGRSFLDEDVPVAL